MYLSHGLIMDWKQTAYQLPQMYVQEATFAFANGTQNLQGHL